MIKYISLGSCLLALAFICGCRSQKAVTKADTSATDTCATASTRALRATIDSLVAYRQFDFDTLEISVARQADTSASAPEIFRLRAVRGSVVNTSRHHALALSAYNNLDSVAYKRCSSASLAEHTATTAVAEPPKTTPILLACGIGLLLVLGWFAYLRLRK